MNDTTSRLTKTLEQLKYAQIQAAAVPNPNPNSKP